MHKRLLPDRSHVPSPHGVPDQLEPCLFIGSKESAFNRDTLARLGITRVLVCCSALTEYHASDARIRCNYYAGPVFGDVTVDMWLLPRVTCDVMDFVRSRLVAMIASCLTSDV